MLKSMLGKKSDYPLATIKSVQQILSEVPNTDAMAALMELSTWIESLCERVEDFRLDHQVAVLRLLDEAAQPFVRKVLRDYFAVQVPNKFQENRAWTALNRFFTFTEQMHMSILNSVKSGNRYASTIKSELPLLAVRGIIANMNRMKLGAVHYALIDQMHWDHLVGIYTFAEERDFLNETVSVYPGIGLSSTVKREFAGIMVWYSVGTGSLSPIQIHIAERLVAYLNKHLEVNTQLGAGSQLAVDLAQPKPPVRVFTETSHSPGVRFVGIGAADFTLIDLIKTLEKGKSIVPQDINMGGAVYEAELVRDVAKHLLARCILPPPTRKSSRHKLQVKMVVVYGYQSLLDNTNVGLNFSHDANEIWSVEDISVTGFRSVNPPSVLNSVRIGTLIGSRPENVENWGAGVVRRLSRDIKNNVHIGVEILANQVIGVTLGSREDFRKGDRNHALYLNRPNDTSGEAWLLMKPGMFSTGRSYNLEVLGKTYLLLPLGMIESGDDYDWVRYRKMEQENTSGDESWDDITDYS